MVCGLVFHQSVQHTGGAGKRSSPQQEDLVSAAKTSFYVPADICGNGQVFHCVEHARLIQGDP